MSAEAKKDDDKEADGKAAEGAGEHGGEGAGEEGGGKKKSKLKLILLIVIPLVLLIGAGAGAYFMGFIGGHAAEPGDCSQVKEGDENYEACAEELAKAAAGNLPGTFVGIPDMIVNLNSNSKQPRFLKISLKVELKKPEDQVPFETALPRVVDQFQTYMRELRVEDLRGSSGMYRMKIELLNRVRAAAPTIEVSDVLFQEIMIQ
jgi:flagellar FliL protein